MRALSLHHLVAMEVGPMELVRIAAEVGFDHVCLFVEAPASGGGLDFPVVRQQDVPEIRRIMDGTGITLYNLEIFFVTPDTDISDYRPAFEAGVRLGGSRATACSLDPDEHRFTANFAQFCALAAEYGVKAGIEFMPFTEVKTFEQAVRVIKAAGHPNGALAVDTLHMVRNGRFAADLVALGPALVGYVQLCDGKMMPPTSDYFEEAVNNRMLPGQGEFPLADFLAVLPPDRPLSLEVPINRLRDKGINATERARLILDATRDFLREHEAA